MGLTDSNSNCLDIEEKYKLLRRYTSECYGDLTVIQNKQNNKKYALKQLITQDQLLIKLIEKRKQYIHKNFICLEDFWFSGDQSLCSNIRKVQMVFEYIPATLDQEMKSRVEKGQRFTDTQIVQIVIQLIQCLQYLEQKNILHLISNIKTILYCTQTHRPKIIENQQLLIHGCHGPPSSSSNQKQAPRKKQLNLNIVGLLSTKKMLPLHPHNQPKDVCEMTLNSEKLCHQNLWVIGLIAIGLCWMRDPLQLAIFGKGGYIFQKIDKRIGQIKNKYPGVHQILSLYMTQRKKYQKFSYAKILSEISSQRKSFQKEKQNEQGYGHKLIQREKDLEIQIQPIEKIVDKKQKDKEKLNKKLSYLRQMRLSNNDIPNQY